MRKILSAMTLLCLIFSSTMLLAQESRTITGRVTDEEGSPLPGVNVVVKGTTNGTVTDADGNYSLNITGTGGTLVFTFVGLATKEVPIGNSSTVDTTMEADVTQLSEVVVTALGLEQNRDEIGTASSQVRGESVARAGEPTLINGLSGKASGINIIRSSGDPGAGSYIQIRGQSTITGNLQPLIILDGVPISNSSLGGGVDGVVQQSRLNDINPADIESVEILKGASAAAIWGTRAANGVMVITTKKGASQQGKINISLSSTYSLDEVYLTHNTTNNWGTGTAMQFRYNPPGGYSWGDYIPDRAGGPDDFITEGETGYAGYFEAADGTRFYAIAPGDVNNPHGGKRSRETYDYRDYLFKTGTFWDNTISLSGGDEDGNFYISLGNLTQEGVLRYNSDYDRTTVRFNGTKRFNPVVRLGTTLSYTDSKSNRIQMGSNTSGLYLGGLRTSPDFNSEYYVGTYVNPLGLIFPNRQRSYRNPLGNASANAVYDNPLWTMQNNLSTSQVGRFIGSAELGISPLDWLDITGRLGVDTYTDRRKDFFDPQASQALGGSLTLQTVRENQFNADLFAQGRFQLAEGLSLTALIGANANQRDFENLGATSNSFFIATDIPEDITNAAPENQLPFNSRSTIRTGALYSTLDFAFADQLFVNLTGRAESASTFGSGASSTFFFPSASVAWQFTQYLGDNDIFSFGKLRAAFGSVGVQPAPYLTVTYFGVGGVADTWGSGLSSSAYGGGYTESATLGNANLKPERKTEIEVGTDLRFVNDRFSLGFTYFQNETTDAILSVATASTTGFNNITANAASLENNGFEIDLGADVIKTDDFTWNITANWSRYRNKVTDLAGTTSLFLAGFTGTSSRAVEGHPIGVLWGVDWARDENGNIVLDERGFPTAGTQETVIGDPNPSWRSGIGNTFRWKGFSLYALFDLVWGGDIWAGTYGIMSNFGRSMETDVITSLTPAEAAATRVTPGPANASLGGTTVAERYPLVDGVHTFRGSVADFGGGPVALDQTWYLGNGGGFGPVASQFIKDATNWRLREVTLSYRLGGSRLTEATKLSSIELSVTGRNLWIDGPDIDIIGNDPETNLTGISNGRGLEYFNNPATRSYLFSIRINY